MNKATASAAATIMNEPILPLLNSFRRGGSTIGAVGIVALLVGFAIPATREGAFQSYLFAWVFVMSFSMGCFALTILHHVLRASWGRAILRILEAGSSTLPWMGLFFLPILLGTIFHWHHLYHWAQPGVMDEDPLLRAKLPYLHVGWWAFRSLLYFVIWIGLARWFNHSSLAQDRTGNRNLAIERVNVAAPGLVILVLTITFAFTDWVMTLDPHWFSTIWGVIFLVGQGLTALAFSALLMTRFATRRPFSEVVTPQLTRDLGNLLLAFTMLWAYMNLSQWLIIYAANLPEEVVYYTRRLENGGRYLGAFILVFQFFAPFLLLLSGKTKRTLGYLSSVAILILVMRLVDLFYIVTPFFHETGAEHSTGLTFRLTDIAAVVGLTGVWMALFFGQLKRHPLLPRHDLRVQEALETRHA